MRSCGWLTILIAVLACGTPAVATVSLEMGTEAVPVGSRLGLVQNALLGPVVRLEYVWPGSKNVEGFLGVTARPGAVYRESCPPEYGARSCDPDGSYEHVAEYLGGMRIRYSGRSVETFVELAAGLIQVYPTQQGGLLAQARAGFEWTMTDFLGVRVSSGVRVSGPDLNTEIPVAASVVVRLAP